MASLETMNQFNVCAHVIPVDAPPRHARANNDDKYTNPEVREPLEE